MPEDNFARITREAAERLARVAQSEERKRQEAQRAQAESETRKAEKFAEVSLRAASVRQP